MYKIFTLAAAIAIMPLSQKFYPVDFNADNTFSKKAYVFTFKNTVTTNFWEPEKKPTEAWSQNWMGQAQENIRKAEYNFTWEEKYKAYCTPNRKNNLRFFYNDKGFTVEPRTTQIPIGDYDPLKRPDEIKYKNIPNLPTGQAGWKVKFNLDKRQVGKGYWNITDNKAEYIASKITVQYVNSDEGMRQNFIVLSPLSKSHTLKINFSIKTKLKTYLLGNQLQFFHKKTNVLNYEQLKVWDAKGTPLKASIKRNKRNKFCIQVNTKNAVYPITIDPLSNTPDSTPDDANQDGASFGLSVASAGDVNGDGYSDVIIGAQNYTDGANTSEGRAFVYHGSATGLSATPNNTPDDADQATALFGNSVASAGDVNGDGYSDVIIGARYYNDGANSYEGRAFVYHGSATGLSATPNSTPDDCNQAWAEFGISVASAGDVNGDGFSDVIIGAWYYDDESDQEGRAFVYHGSASGLSTTPNIFFDETDEFFAEFGYSVASAGDVNGDGYSDVIIGTPKYTDGANTWEGRAFVYHGSATGLSATPNSILDDANQAFAFFGFSIASAGDVNGDGYSDVIIGAQTYTDGANSQEGRAFVYHGSATGLSATPDSTPDDANQASARFGTSVASAGDVNGDGYSDVIIGAFWYDDGANTDEGKAFVYFGSATGLSATPNSTPDDANQADAYFGISVASAGDVNGDGYSDVIIGAYSYDDGTYVAEGRAFVYHGSAAGLSTTPNNSPDDADLADVNFGYSVASAGDVNADGYSDVIIGAPQYDEGANANVGRVYVYHGSTTGLAATPNSTLDEIDQALAYFGWSVASAGDVNGDGFSDVIVGASQYDEGAFINEGRAFIYHGSVTGLSLTANSTPDDADQAGAHFGISVASAGDVNGDGYGDVIIGAYLFDDTFSDEGVAFVYHGSASGLSATPNSMCDDADQLNANFGISVSSAGDVNGDGFSDVVIGANSYDAVFANEGRAFVYHGSAVGLPATPNSTPDDANQLNANFGCSVASAGDVNGDGYSDVIIGANSYDDVFANEGRAFVYYGSAAGLPGTPDITLDGANQLNAIFGNSVASAGDVNGDGYNDVIVGAYQYDDGFVNEGLAFVYHGSAGGLSATPNSILDDADQVNAFFGVSVSAAGDINGDGYSDVIIGAYGYTDMGNVGEGRAFVYNGNDSTSNQRNNLRLYNSDLTTPINSSNFIFGNFGAGLYTRSFLGRDKAKMVWETRLNYNAYSGNPITNSTFFTAQQTNYTDLGLTGTELKNLVDKLLGSGKYTKVRARVKYDPVTAITGQVYGPWRNVSSIIDANSLGALPFELISFKATWLQKGRSAKLDFTTDKENGICCFTIEKSADGFNFYPIGSLPAKNITGLQSYSFIDNNATGKKQFYRLKIKGEAGQIEYSNIQQLQNNGATEILVFPNPATDVLQLQLNSSFDKMNVQIINSAGQTVKQLNNLSTSNQTITIPVQNLPAGQYWLRLQSGSEKQVLQFVKE